MLIQKQKICTFRSSRRSFQALIFEEIALLVFCINNSILIHEALFILVQLKVFIFQSIVSVLINLVALDDMWCFANFNFDTGRSLKAKVIAFFLCKPIQSGSDPSLKQNFCLKDKVCGTNPWMDCSRPKWKNLSSSTGQKNKKKTDRF